MISISNIAGLKKLISWPLYSEVAESLIYIQMAQVIQALAMLCGTTLFVAIEFTLQSCGLENLCPRYVRVGYGIISSLQ